MLLFTTPLLVPCLFVMCRASGVPISWLRLAQGFVVLAGMTLTGYSQSQPAWAQEIDRLRGEMDGYHRALESRVRDAENRIIEHSAKSWHPEGQAEYLREMRLVQTRQDRQDDRLFYIIMGGGIGFLGIGGGGVYMASKQMKNTQMITQIRQNGGHKE
jgi:hypothetical protein